MDQPRRGPDPLTMTPPVSMLEVDDRVSVDNDVSPFDSSSLTSSIYEFEYENGRRYHAYKAGSYPLPNDEAELERIDIKHHVIMLLMGGNLHLAPLVDPKTILDIGTGTGIWAMEMADQFPGATVIGTDLSPVQPMWVPDNVRFEIDDVESKWVWRENYFDYIHSRFMISSISSWERMIRKAYKHLKPGGYLELQELDCRFRSDDGSLSEDSNLALWSKLICDAAEMYNRPIPYYHKYRGWLEKAGFVDIQQVIFKSPTNSWPKNKLLKEVSKFQLVAHIEGLEGISLGLLTRGLQWKAEEVKVLMAKLRPELKDRSIHSYQTIAVLVGRKPENPQTPDYTTAAASRGHTPSTPGSIRSPGDTVNSPPSTRDIVEESGSLIPPGSEEEALVNGANAFTPIVTVSQPPADNQNEKSTD